MGLRLHHLLMAAPVGCEDQARSFYGQLLELTEIPKPPNLARLGGVWFQCGLQEIHIGVEANFRPARKAHPAFLVDDLEELRKRLSAANVAVREGEPLEGYHRFYADDPFGNRIEFLQPVNP